MMGKIRSHIESAEVFLLNLYFESTLYKDTKDQYEIDRVENIKYRMKTSR